MKRFFYCTKTGKNKPKPSKKRNEKVRQDSVRRKKSEKPAIFTSTVGKASGNAANNPANTLQDIISQLEDQTR